MAGGFSLAGAAQRGQNGGLHKAAGAARFCGGSTCLLYALAAILASVWVFGTAAILSKCGVPAGFSHLIDVVRADMREISSDLRTGASLPDDENLLIGVPAHKRGLKRLTPSPSGAPAAVEAEPSPLASALAESRRVKELTARIVAALAGEREEGAAEAGTSEFAALAATLAAHITAAEAAGGELIVEEPAAEPAAAAAPTVSPDAEYSQQTCYLQTDESEICVYDNLLCYDGTSPVVVVAEPVRVPERIVDYTHSCADFRYYEPSAMEYSGCAYKYEFQRAYNKTARMLPASDFPLPLTRRRWGPQNRNGHLYFKEVRPEEVWGPPTDPEAPDLRKQGNPGLTGPAEGELWLSPTGAYGATLLASAPLEFGGVPGLGLARRTLVGNRTIDWVDGSLWLAGIDGQFWQNPYHWWSKIGVLYDALRSNRTPAFGDHPNDGYLQWQKNGEITSRTGGIDARFPNHNRMAFRQGAQWDLPPMDQILFTGDGAVVLEGVHKLNPWFRRTMELASQPHSKHYFNDVLGKLDNWHYLCTTRGAMLGVKNKLFTGRSDGWMWRQYAYRATGLIEKGYKSHPMYPPRKVTIIDRKGLNGRGIYNKPELIAAIEAVGLPYELVPNMASLTFEQQVELMAGTGILIAPHGAHLTNAMFMPAHSAVIELFPYMMKKNTYRHLTLMMDLHYIPYYSWELLPNDLNKTVYGVALMQENYYYKNCVKVNITSYESLMEHACNAMSKNYPIMLPFPAFSEVIRNAVDSIGAFSLLNPEWAAVAETQGIPIPPPPDSALQQDKYGVYG